MANNLIGDILSIERSISGAIVDTFNAVDIIRDHVRVYDEERFPDSDENDDEISAIPDPNNPNNDDIRLTSILQLGLFACTEFEYTADRSTQLDFIIPITFDFSVVDRWDISDPSNPWRFRSSMQFVKAVYLKGRQAFKTHPVTQASNRTFGFDNVVHDYLQLDNAVTVVDAETKGAIHSLEMSLTVHLLGVTV